MHSQAMALLTIVIHTVLLVACAPRDTDARPLYSVNVILYEIGVWRDLAQHQQSSGSRSSLQTHRPDPHPVDKVTMDDLITNLKRYTGTE